MTTAPIRLITLVMSDIEGSTKLWEAEPDLMRVCVRDYETIADTVVSKNRGRRLKDRGEGDSLFLVFERPTDALFAAAELQVAWQSHSWSTSTPIRVRLAVHTGEVIDSGSDFYGSTPNRCARLREAAHSHQTLVSRATAELASQFLTQDLVLHSHGLHRLRDLARPEEIFELIAPGIAPCLRDPKTLDTYPNNLRDRLTHFIGREHDLKRMHLILQRSRLMTLVGLGGIGKTRLATEFAARRIEEFPGGVYVLEFAKSQANEPIVPLLARAVGLDPSGPVTLSAVAQSIGKLSALIVLDNVEHRRSEIAEFALECLAQMRSIRVLATGRTSLGVAGEQRLPIRGLSVPPLRSGIEDVLASEAGSLFLDRLTSLNPDFVFGERVVRSIGGLCRAASGMPLAIQIFASRCAYVSPEEVFTGRYEDFARPETSFGEEERHKSIQLAVSSSFESLEPADQNLLARTAAFRGGFTLDHVRQLNSEGGSSSAAMGRLVTGSLVDIENSGNSELRYLILEPVREFLELECPQFVNEGKEILFSTMKEKLTRLEPKLNADDPTSMDEIEREQDNIAVALSMGLEPRFRADAIKLACCLYRHWTARGYHQEGKAWLESLLTEAEGIDEALLGRAYNTLGAVLGIGGNASASHEAHERAFIHYRSAGDSRGMTSSEISCGIGLYQLKKFDEAVLRFDSASERARSMGAYEYVAYSEANRSSALAFLGRWDESEQIARTLLDSRESISDHLRAPLLLTCIRCSLGRSDAGRTQQLLLELVPLVAGSRDIERLTVTLTLAARHQLLVGKLDLAFYLYTSAKSLSLRAGVHLETWIIADVDSNINDLQEKLSPGVAGDLLRKSHGIRTTTAINLLRDQYIP